MGVFCVDKTCFLRPGHICYGVTWYLLVISIYPLAPKGAKRLLGDGTPSEIIIHVVRNHCTKFGALVHSVATKTIRHQTKLPST